MGIETVMWALMTAAVSLMSLSDVLFGDDDDGDSGNSERDTDGSEEGSGDRSTSLSDVEIIDITGTIQQDTLTGTDAYENIDARASDDTVEAGGGNDTILGRAGSDIIDAGLGNDFLSGGSEQDTLIGGSGYDTLLGGTGDDSLVGGADDDTLAGNEGADTQHGGNGNDILVGVAPIDGNEAIGRFLSGMPTEDTDDGDVLYGELGDDRFYLGANDNATGGEGADEYVAGDWISNDDMAIITDYDPDADSLTLGYNAANGVPVVDLVTDGEDVLISQNGNLVARVTGAASSLTTDDIALLAYDRPSDSQTNHILGEAGENLLSGEHQDNTLMGEGADDTIWAGDGDDTAMGGDGDDLVIGARGADDVQGNDGNDTVYGIWGEDLLNGGDGDDTLIDSYGTDTLDGGTGNDVIIADDLTDELGDLNARLHDRDFSGSLTDVDFTRVAEDDEGDEVFGGTGDDTIYFGEADTLTGGDGADSFQTGDRTLNSEISVITDFDSNEDVLLYHYTSDAEPTVTVRLSGSDATVRINGISSILVQGVGSDFTADMVTLVPASS